MSNVAALEAQAESVERPRDSPARPKSAQGPFHSPEARVRDIVDILHFRQDIAPFLAHLTKRTTQATARQVLEQIIQAMELHAGSALVSDARFGGNTNNMTPEDRQRFFGALCFTETPLNEIHCLLDIAYRQVNLEPYGLVFDKFRLKIRGVSPVLYFNNESAQADGVIQALFSLKATYPNEAEALLPLVSIFGQKVKPPGAANRPPGSVNFAWEREWRYRRAAGPLAFDVDEVFCGLCPHEEIAHFEGLLPPVKFVDPTRNMKWYATSLIASRQRLGLQDSVV